MFLVLVNSAASGPNLLVASKERLVETQIYVRELAESTVDSNDSRVSKIACSRHISCKYVERVHFG